MTITATARCSDALQANSFPNPAAIAFNPSGSTVTLASSYTDIFIHVSQTDCPLNSCTLKVPGCGSALTAQSNVVLGSAPFSISAIETNPNGYTVNFCFECEINPAGQSSIFFTKDAITITADQLDCSTSLSPVGWYTNPPAVSYNSAGSQVMLAPSYESFFTHTIKSDCVLSTCYFLEQGCGTPLAA